MSLYQVYILSPSHFIKVFGVFIFIFFLSEVKAQGQHDSIVFIYRSENLVEITKPLFPKLVRVNKKNGSGWGAVLTPENDGYQTEYGVLENGEIKVFNRFNLLTERYVFRDSVKILEEKYANQILSYQTKEVYGKDTSVVQTTFEGGKPKHQTSVRFSYPNLYTELYIEWYPNGQVKSYCLQKWKTEEEKLEKKWVEECDYWNEEGEFQYTLISDIDPWGFERINTIKVDAEGKPIE